MKFFTLGQYVRKFHNFATVNPGDIITFADYDLTLAAKDRVDFDRAALTPEQYDDLSKFASNTGRFTVVTARGEKSVLGYFNEHGPIDISLASNSGHVYRDTISPLSKQIIIPIQDHEDHELREIVEKGIDSILYELKLAFSDITTDNRELCGAAIYNFAGPSNSEHHERFQELADELRCSLPEHIKKNLLFSKKHREVVVTNPDDERFDGALVTQGYIDIKPRGMDKGVVVTELLERYRRTITGNPFVVVAGDSSPDYDMMRAIDKLVPNNRRLFVSVGNGLCPDDQKHCNMRGSHLLDVVIEGPQERPIFGFYELMAAISKTRPARSPMHTTCGVWKKIIDSTP